MTMCRKYLNLLVAAVLLVLPAACSEDDDKYNSIVPEFSDMQFHPLDKASGNVIYAGEPFVATAVQSSRGRLLDRTTYAWALNDEDEEMDVPHKYRKEVVYDVQSDNPTDTIIVSRPGNYRLRFRANYRVSGTGSGGGSIISIPGGQITYYLSTLTYQVTIDKNLKVVARP